MVSSHFPCKIGHIKFIACFPRRGTIRRRRGRFFQSLCKLYSDNPTWHFLLHKDLELREMMPKKKRLIVSENLVLPPVIENFISRMLINETWENITKVNFLPKCLYIIQKKEIGRKDDYSGLYYPVKLLSIFAYILTSISKPTFPIENLYERQW